MKTLIFVHVAKTGGLSLRNAMAGPSTVVIPHTASLNEWGEKASNATIAVGHIPYGLHTYLNKSREYDYLTILRHPVERVLSKYYYTYKTKELISNNSIPEFMVGYFYCVVQNLMVKQLAGIPILEDISVGFGAKES
jgi:hypothetical protein